MPLHLLQLIRFVSSVLQLIQTCHTYRSTELERSRLLLSCQMYRLGIEVFRIIDVVRRLSDQPISGYSIYFGLPPPFVISFDFRFRLFDGCRCVGILSGLDVRLCKQCLKKRSKYRQSESDESFESERQLFRPIEEVTLFGFAPSVYHLRPHRPNAISES